MMNAREIELFQIKVCLLIKEYCDQTGAWIRKNVMKQMRQNLYEMTYNNKL